MMAAPTQTFIDLATTDGVPYLREDTQDGDPVWVFDSAGVAPIDVHDFLRNAVSGGHISHDQAAQTFGVPFEGATSNEIKVLQA